MDTVARASAGDWRIALYEPEEAPQPGALFLEIDHPTFDLQVTIAGLAATESMIARVRAGDESGVDPTEPSRSVAKFQSFDLFVFVHEFLQGDESLWFLLLDRTHAWFRLRVSVSGPEIPAFIQCLEAVVAEAREDSRDEPQCVPESSPTTKRSQMNEEELLRVVRAMMSPGDITEDQLDQLTETFVETIPHPGGTDLIYYPDHWGLPDESSAEEIVKEGLSWRPRVLAMPITRVEKHMSRPDLFCYGVKLEGKMRTQIVSPLKLRVGDVCAVALSGVRLHSGKVVTHGFTSNAFTAGEILGATDKLAGVELSIDEFPNS